MVEMMRSSGSIHSHTSPEPPHLIPTATATATATAALLLLKAGLKRARHECDRSHKRMRLEKDQDTQDTQRGPHSPIGRHMKCQVLKSCLRAHCVPKSHSQGSQALAAQALGAHETPDTDTDQDSDQGSHRSQENRSRPPEGSTTPPSLTSLTAPTAPTALALTARPQEGKSRVVFHKLVQVIIIPTRKEYKAASIQGQVWYSREEMQECKAGAKRELLSFAARCSKVRRDMDFKCVLSMFLQETREEGCVV